MKIVYSSYSLHNDYKNTSVPRSFGAASDISLNYIYENRLRLLPQRMRDKVKHIVLTSHKLSSVPTLRELHLNTYSQLLECKTLGKAQAIFPEFREVLQANAVISKGSKNTRTIADRVPLEDLSLYILKERWAKLKTVDEVAKSLGLKNRSSIAWVMDKIRMPDLGKNYQALLKASDETLNRQIAQKVKSYNEAHPETIIAHNRMLAQSPEILQMNKDFADEMWQRMPELKEEMRNFRRDNPHIRACDFYESFWNAFPQYKKLMSDIRKEIGPSISKQYSASKK